MILAFLKSLTIVFMLALRVKAQIPVHCQTVYTHVYGTNTYKLIPGVPNQTPNVATVQSFSYPQFYVKVNGVDIDLLPECAPWVEYFSFDGHYAVSYSGNQIILTPTYYAQSDISSSPKSSIVQARQTNLASIGDLPKAQIVNMNVVDYCASKNIAAPTDPQAILVSLTNDQSLSLQFQLSQGSSDDLTHCKRPDRIRYYKITPSGTYLETNWFTIDAATAQLTLNYPGVQNIAYRKSIDFEYELKDPLFNTVWSKGKFYFEFKESTCSTNTLTLTQLIPTIQYNVNQPLTTETYYSYASLLQQTSSLSTCNNYKMQVTSSWCGIKNSGTLSTQGLTIYGCTTQQSVGQQTFTIKVTDNFGNSQQMQFTVNLFGCPQASFQLQDFTSVTNLKFGTSLSYSETFTVHGGNLCGTMTYSYRWLVNDSQSVNQQFSTAAPSSFTITNHQYTSQACAPSCVVTNPLTIQHGVGQNTITVSPDASAKNKYLHIWLCVQQDQSQFGRSSTQICQQNWQKIKVYDCSGFFTPTITPPADVHLTYNIQTPVLSFNISPFVSNDSTCPVSFKQLTEVSSEGVYLPISQLQMVLTGTNYQLTVNLNNQYGTVPLSYYANAEYVLENTHHTVDNLTAKQKIYLLVLPDCSQVTSNFGTSTMSQGNYQVYQGQAIINLLPFTVSNPKCPVSSVQIQIWKNGVATSETFAVAQALTHTATKYQISYNTPSVKINLNTLGDNNKAIDNFDSTAQKGFTEYEVKFKLNIDASYSKSLPLKLTQNCNNQNLANGPVLQITTPSDTQMYGSDTTLQVQLNTPSLLHLPKFTINEPTCALSYTLTPSTSISPNKPTTGDFSIFTVSTSSNPSNSLQVSFNSANSSHYGYYNFDFCAKTYQSSTVCRQVSILVFPDCSTYNVNFIPFVVGYQVSNPEILLKMFDGTSGPVRSQDPVACPVYQISLEVTKTGQTSYVSLTNGAVDPNYSLFTYTPYDAKTGGSGHLKVYTTNNDLAFANATPDGYSFKVSARLSAKFGTKYMPATNSHSFTADFIKVFVFKNCNAATMINSATINQISLDKYIINNPAQTSSWSVQPQFTPGCFKFYSLKDATTGAVPTTAFTIDQLTGQVTLQATDTTLTYNYVEYQLAVDANSHNNTVMKTVNFQNKVKIYSECYAYSVQFSPNQQRKHTYTLSQLDNIVDPLKPVLVLKDIAQPVFEFKLRGIIATLDPNCGSMVYNSAIDPTSPSMTFQTTSTGVKIGTQNPQDVGSYKIKVIFDLMSLGNIFSYFGANNPLNYIPIPEYMDLYVQDICQITVSEPTQVILNKALWQTSVLNPYDLLVQIDPARIGPTLTSYYNNGLGDPVEATMSVDYIRYCGQQIFNVTFSKEFQEMLIPKWNEPLANYPVNMKVVPTLSSQIGNHTVDVQVTFSRNTTLNPTLKYQFNVTVKSCQLISIQAPQIVSSKLDHKFDMLNPIPVEIPFTQIVQRPQCEYQVKYSFKQQLPALQQQVTYPWATIVEHKNGTGKIVIDKPNVLYANQKFDLWLRADFIQNFDNPELQFAVSQANFSVEFSVPSSVLNSPPPSMQSLQPQINLPKNEAYQYQLPVPVSAIGYKSTVSTITVQDDEGNNVQLSFVSWDLSDQPPVLKFIPPDKSYYGKIFTISITVQDSNPILEKKSVQKIILKMPDLPAVVLQKQKQVQNTTAYPVMNITKVTSRGKFNLTFTQNMTYPESILILNSTNTGQQFIQMRVYQNKTRDGPEQFYKQNTIFNWTITNVTDLSISFQLNFTNADLISKIIPDTLYLEILDRSVFVSKESRLAPKNINQILAVRIHKQDLTQISLQPTFTSISTTIIAFLASNFALSYIFAGSMQMMWGLVGALQIFVYTMLLKLNRPSNLNDFMQMLLTLITFDLFQADKLYPLIFNFSKTPSFSDFFDEMNFSGSTYINGIGSMFMIQMWIILQIVFMVIFSLVVDYCGTKFRMMERINKKFKLVKKGNMVITAIYQSYFETAIQASITFYGLYKSEDKKVYYQTFSDALSTAYCIIYSVLNSIIPFIMLNLAFKLKKASKNKKQDWKVFDKYVDLFEGLRTKHLRSLMQPFAFLLRRMAQIFCIVVLGSVANTVLQIQVYYYTSLLYTCYMLHSFYLDTIFGNYLEAFNEIMTLINLLHLWAFCDWIEDSNTIQKMGNSQMLCIVFQAFVNIVIVMKFQIQSAIFTVKKWIYLKKMESNILKEKLKKQKEEDMKDQKFVAEQIIKKVFVNRQLSDIEEEKEDDRYSSFSDEDPEKKFQRRQKREKFLKDARTFKKVKTTQFKQKIQVLSQFDSEIQRPTNVVEDQSKVQKNYSLPQIKYESLPRISIQKERVQNTVEQVKEQEIQRIPDYFKRHASKNIEINMINKTREQRLKELDEFLKNL